MRVVKYLVLVLIVLCLVVVGMANRIPVTLTLFPESLVPFTKFNASVTLALYVVIIAAVAVGLLVAVGVGLGDAVGLLVAVGVGLGVAVGLLVAVGVSEGVGVGGSKTTTSRGLREPVLSKRRSASTPAGPRRTRPWLG